MSNKTSDENVANIERLNNFANMTFLYGHRVNLNVSGLKGVQQDIKNVLAEREQMLKERDVANDSVIAHKFAVMQQQLEQKDKRIKELEEYIFIAPNLDEMTVSKYIAIQQEAYIRGKAEEQQKAEQIIYENYIPMQAVIDKMEELNKEIKNGDEIEAIFKIKQQQILQELLERGNK